MLIGNQVDEELFPDGIHYHFIGKPTLFEHSNSHFWAYSEYIGKVGDTPIYKKYSVTINRNSLDMSRNHRSTDPFGNMHADDYYYSCRLIDKVSFEKYKTEMSEEYMGRIADACEKEEEEQVEREERERKSKI